MSICTFPDLKQKHIKANDQRVFEAFIQCYCLHGLRVCFTIAKYEIDMLSLCKTINVFIDAFCYLKVHFHQLGPFKLIKTMLKSLHVLLGLSPVWNHCRERSYLAFNNRV